MKRFFIAFSLLFFPVLFGCDNGKGSEGAIVIASDEPESSSSFVIPSSSSEKTVSSSNEVSSSSVTIKRSSSSIASSSSFAGACKTVDECLNPNIRYRTFTDERDGHEYKFVYINNRFWMAENLNYFDTVAVPELKGNTWCYGDDPKNCERYGRLYNWTAASNFNTRPLMYDTIQGICPSGWHLPIYEDYHSLLSVVEELDGNSGYVIKALRTKKGWLKNDGTDLFGFSAIPAGYRNNFGLFEDENESAVFWNIKWDAGTHPYAFAFSNFENAAYGNLSYDKIENDTSAFSIRCIKNIGRDEPSLVPKDSIVDERDGKVYKTVVIGNQTWMAQNLDYADSVAVPEIATRSRCFTEADSSCEQFGRLYAFSVAIDSTALANDPDNPQTCGSYAMCPAISDSATRPVRGLCPVGWHIPNKGEWDELLRYLTEDLNLDSNTVNRGLKAEYSWRFSDRGTDEFGFTALPISVDNFEKGASYDKSYGEQISIFMSSTLMAYPSGLSLNYYVTCMELFENISDIKPRVGDIESRYKFPIRCIKD